MLQHAYARYSSCLRSSRRSFLLLRKATPFTNRGQLSSSSEYQRYGCSKASGTFTSTIVSRPLTTSARRSALQSPGAVQDVDTRIKFDNDTIYALSTGVGARAGIAIVRISGPACLQIYSALCPSKAPLKPRYANVRMLHDPSDNQIVLDSSALALYFPAPNTVTGEDVLELHIHGGPATIKAVLGAIPKCSSQQRTTRMAEPGEFTRRAFENDRLDLAQVEALSDTLAAETEQQRRAAVRGSSPKLGRTYDGWRDQLLYARGELEALIDFSEDQHFDESPAELLDNVAAQVDKIISEIIKHEAAAQRGNLLRRGIEIALIGPPNAGKSSLLNLIVGREASIVSSEAGTTRDIVEVRYDIGGYLCTFADTAGLRILKSRPTRDFDWDAGTNSETYSRLPSESEIVGEIEQEGIRRAKARAKDSDLIIFLASIERTDGDDWTIRYDAESLSLLYGDIEPPFENIRPKPGIIVINKIDSAPSASLIVRKFQEQLKQDFGGRPSPPIIGISCLEATIPFNDQNNDPGNIGTFTAQLKKTIRSITEIPLGSEDLLAVTERQRQLLSQCREDLFEFVLEAGSNSDALSDKSRNIDIDSIEIDIVTAAEHLRSAADCLARITGRGMAGDVEEVLGVVFEKFCVGK
ncbi:related to GTPase MSS1, mitochondrial [Phialocephala subalpina]|uniref:Related to GTPase MSS1, mitochondrial n=1 Tax=Phialocephala subalpina TaxID=576137 RepID=A0A1L7X509_9HELO|nr:related to GTPase MSS1, mitochondrial [Phialocephala subalpina]